MTAVPSPAPVEVPDSPRRELVVGAVVAGLFFVLFLGFAALYRMDAAAFAPGQVMVSGNRQAVQHREGGTVSAIHVAEGDRVTRGQILIELSSGELQAEERGLAGQVYALLAQRSRMIAERDRRGSVPTPPEFAALTGPDLVLANEALRLQRLQYSARLSGRSTEQGVLGQRVQQLMQQKEGLARQIEANIEQRRLILEELEGIRSLAEKGYAPLTRVRALERETARLDGELGSLRAQSARTDEQIGETRLQSSGVTTKLNEDVAEQLRLVEVQLNELRPRLAEARAKLARTRIAAPATGQVVGLTAFTAGGVVQPGQLLMEIVPTDASQIIVARVNPADIDNVRLGMQSEVKFPGLRERAPPILHGRVTRVSADSFTDEQSGQSHYRAEIVVPEAELARLGAASRDIRPGMPVEVQVQLRKRTALSYLFEPLGQSLWRSGGEQ